MITPHQLGIALVVPGNSHVLGRGDRVVGFMAPPPSLGRYVALVPEYGVKFASVGEATSWLWSRNRCLDEWLAAGAEGRPVGLIFRGGGGP